MKKLLFFGAFLVASAFGYARSNSPVTVEEEARTCIPATLSCGEYVLVCGDDMFEILDRLELYEWWYCY